MAALLKAGIIAAGEGSRLRAEGVVTAKPLVRINGVPLIERLLTSFARSGISDVVCIVNEDSLSVREYVESTVQPIPVRFIVRSTPSSMHSLFALAPHLQDGRFLLSTVDAVYCEDDFRNYLRYADDHPDLEGLLAVTSFVEDESPLYVDLDDNRRIRRFSKSAPTGWVTGGLYIFSPRIFDEMGFALATGLERLRNFLAHLVTRGYTMEGFPFGKIVDVDHVGDIAAAEALVKIRL